MKRPYDLTTGVHLFTWYGHDPPKPPPTWYDWRPDLLGRSGLPRQFVSGRCKPCALVFTWESRLRLLRNAACPECKRRLTPTCLDLITSACMFVLAGPTTAPPARVPR